MKRSSLTLGLVLAVACAPAPAHRRPDIGVQVPEQWSAGPHLVEGTLRQDWWTAFGDPALDSIIQETLAHNHDLQAAAARLDAAASLARIAGADLLPTVDVNLAGGRRKQNFIGFPIPGSEDRVLSATFTTYGVSLDTRWEADLWGSLRAGKAAALAEFQAAEAELAGARLSLAGQAAKAWFALAEARRQVELSETTVELFRATAERVRSRYEAGLRPSLDLRLTLSNLASAEANLEQRRDQLQRVRRQLELLLGHYPGGALDGSRELPPPPETIPPGLPATLVSRRPDLVAEERRLVASNARLAQARKALYPRIQLTGSGGTSTRELGDLLDGDLSVWSLAAGLLQPIFRGGRLRAGVELAGAREREVLSTYVQVALTAYGEVEAALSNEAILARREDALVIAAEQSVAARALAESRYESGLEDIITVLDSQRRALVAESQLLAVRRQRLDVRIDLYLALGGGFDTGSTSAVIPTLQITAETKKRKRS